MDAILVLVGLALGLAVVQQIVGDLIGTRVPGALQRTIAVALGAGLAWTLNYSVFTAFDQTVRADWMHPVFTGLVLVAFGEFVRLVIKALAHRSGEPPVEIAREAQTLRAA